MRAPFNPPSDSPVTPPVVGGTGEVRAGLAAARLCVLVDGGPDRDAFGTLVAGLFRAGVPMVQVRDKRLTSALLADRVALAVTLAANRGGHHRPIVIVNDRPDVAVATGADGVHVGAEDLPVEMARRVVGSDRLVGRTAHDIGEARAAVVAGADMLGVGPCFASTTKTFARQAPRDFLREVADTVAIPAFAIGGVTLDRLDELAAAGFTRVAVGAAITAAPDPAAMAIRFLERLDRSASGRGTP